MHFSSRFKHLISLYKMNNPVKSIRMSCSRYSMVTHNQGPMELQEMCRLVSSSIGGLDDMESSLEKFSPSLTASLSRQVIYSCKKEAPSRRLLRFFQWSQNSTHFDTKDEDFNYVIRVLCEKKDHVGLQILVSELRKNGGMMEKETFSVVADTLVKLGEEDEALGIFKNLDKFNCDQDCATVTAIVSALCSKGHTKKAAGVIRHHRDKISSVKPCIYRCLLYGWSEEENVKEARKVIKEMKGEGIIPDLFCYNTFLRCLCERNLKHNPSGLVPEALNVMMEMRSYHVAPNSISYNMLLSCLGRARRVKESCRVLELMKKAGCDPDWVSYYLVVKVLYLAGRFGKGNKMVDQMIEEGLVPDRKFYYDLIGVLCGVERVNFALDLFDRMKKSSLEGYGPVYDVLIPKLCRGGNFEKGKELWDEALAMDISLSFSKDVLDPSITEVFKPTRKVEEKIRLKDINTDKKSAVTQLKLKKGKRNAKKQLTTKITKKKSASK